jgi:hypothetical protein
MFQLAAKETGSLRSQSGVSKHKDLAGKLRSWRIDTTASSRWSLMQFVV